MGFLENIYIPEIVKGLGITAGHLLRNIRNPERMQTTFYPESRKKLAPRVKLGHRLMQRPDRTVRCTACYCCATACPADCITIVAADHPNPEIEKFAVKYTIDSLKCVYCGFCVEACPCDAIRMDSQQLYPVEYDRESFIHDVDHLLNNHPNGLDPVSVYLESEHGVHPENTRGAEGVPGWVGRGEAIPTAEAWSAESKKAYEDRIAKHPPGSPSPAEINKSAYQYNSN